MMTTCRKVPSSLFDMFAIIGQI